MYKLKCFVNMMDEHHCLQLTEESYLTVFLVKFLDIITIMFVGMFMPANMNCITINITLESIEKLKTEKKNQQQNSLNNNASIYKLCVGPVIDREFRHHIVKVAVNPRGDSRVDPQTHPHSHQFVFYDNKLLNCWLSPADVLHEF